MHMKKHLYTILVCVTGALLACIFLFSKKPETKTTAFKERRGTVALSAEWMNSKKAMEGLLAAIEQNPEDHKAMLQLSQAYIQEGRITGDHGYYDKAALELLDKVLEIEPNNFEAMCCKATVLLSQHHFAEGLELAKKALPVNPDNAFIYGIMCDANLELGNYDEAVKMADKMVSVRPDIRSYSRVSYLREIYGDVEGAKQAIKLAIGAGYPGLEQTEWTRCILGHLYETTGELDSAEYAYQVALRERPDYAYAIAGIGRIAKARGNYKDAIFYFEKAKKMMIDFSFSDELTDLYRLDKQSGEADKNAKEVIAMLGPASDVEGENGHGHYADKELAYAYLKINDLDNALKHALLEYQRRPANIDVSETLAWVKYKKGDYSEANTLINIALRTHSKNPVLLTHAGLIKIKNGETEKGMALIKTAAETNPFMDLELRHEASSYLAMK
jgi:tetratricopeptide (TPR) repeat protein